MKPIEFKGQNVVFAKDQKPYLPLPAYQQEDIIIHCWRLSLWERLKILLTGKLWIQVRNFKMPPHPIKPMVDSPFATSSKYE